MIKLPLTKKGFTGYRGWMDKTTAVLPFKKKRILYLGFNERERKKEPLCLTTLETTPVIPISVKDQAKTSMV